MKARKRIRARFPFSAFLMSITALTLSTSCKIEPEQVNVEGVTPAAAAFKKGDGYENSGETPRPHWWRLFHDEKLNSLASRIDSENFQLRAGLARIEQAYAVLGISRSELFPYLNGDGSVKRIRVSENQVGQGGNQNTGGVFGAGGGRGGFENPYTQYRAALAATWEIDLWGRVRNAVRGAQADTVEIEKLTEDLRLSLQSQLAQNYFALRFLDEEKRVLREALSTRRENLELATDRFEGGRTGELDVARAETELASTRADLARLDAPRTRLENAIAVLVGEPASNFDISPSPLDFRLPTIKTGVPMTVLANRPDVAAAIARLASTTARIGVAKAEFFPRVDLIATGGLSSVDSSDFFDWSSRTFTIGPEVTVPIFQGGRLRANLQRARAEQAEALADYQQTVVDALREVEDVLADLAALRAERSAQLQAVSASEKAVSLSNRRYEEGLVSSIEVIDAVREQLNAERRAVQIRSSQYEATVRLIQVIGGGMEERYTK